MDGRLSLRGQEAGRLRGRKAYTGIAVGSVQGMTRGREIAVGL